MNEARKIDMKPSSDIPQQAEVAPPDGEHVSLAWSVHPARERPWSAAGAILLIVLLSGAVSSFAERGWWGVAAAVVLCLSLGRFFFESRLSIDDREVTSRWLLGVRKLELAEVRRIVLGPDAAWVSPYRTPQSRDSRRSVTLHYGRHGEAVRARLRLTAERIGAALVERD